MAEQDDVYVGRRLLEMGVVAREQLVECLFEIAVERRACRATEPLGMMLVRRGLVRKAEIGMILGERVRAPRGDVTPSQSSDLAFGELLVAAGVATSVQVNECLVAQREKPAGAPSRRLGELLVERGYATPDHVRRALAYQSKAIHACVRCGQQYNVVGAQAVRKYRCPSCGGELAMAMGASVTVCQSSIGMPAVPPKGAARTEAVAAADMPVLPPDAQAHVDRAMKLYLRQKVHVKRSVLNDAERFQFELARYGLWVSFLEVVRRFGGLTWQQAEDLKGTDFGAIVKSDAWKRQTVPGYSVRARIASGGFGAIFAAEPVFGGARVALKVMHEDRARDPKLVSCFRHEAALMIRFTHPNIVRGFDYTEEEGLHFIVMELVEGDSLDRVVLESGRGLSPRKTLSIARQIASALQYMQREGYLHRDVKPQNVLVTPEERVKLCDLGLAAEIRPNAGRADFTMGTPGYMSPEQARGEADLKAGSDIYALGCTVYFMLTARKPVGADTSDEVPAERIAEMGRLDLGLVQAPEPVTALLQRMLDPRRESRFGTYEELLGAVDAAAKALSTAPR